MTTVHIKPKTHARLVKSGRKGQSFDDIITELLGETHLLPKFEKSLTNAVQKAELSKKNLGNRRLVHEAVDELISASTEFIAEIKER